MLIAIASGAALLARSAPALGQAPPPAEAPKAPKAPAEIPKAPPDAAPAVPSDDSGPADTPPPALSLLPLTPPARGGLTVTEVEKRAVDVAPRARRASAEQAHAERRADRAGFLFAPRVDLRASYTRLSEVPEISPLFPSLENIWQMQAAVRIPVTEYFSTLIDRYSSAQHLETFQQLQREAEWLGVAYDGAREYYELARAIAQHELAAHRSEQLERFVAEIDVLVRGGELGSVDLAQASARLSGARAAEHRARAARRVAEDVLRRRLGLPPRAPVGIADNLLATIPGPPTDRLELERRALRDRAEIRALRSLILANEDTRDAVASARYPTLSVLGDVTVANPNQRYLPPEAEFNTTWSVGVELAWSPTELSVYNQDLDDSELEVVRAREDLRALRDRIVIEVADAYENAIAADGAVATSREAVEAAEETYEVRRALFRGGEGTSRAVLDAEIDLRTAQLQWIDDVLTTHLARAALDRATGRASRPSP